MRTMEHSPAKARDGRMTSPEASPQALNLEEQAAFDDLVERFNELEPAYSGSSILEKGSLERPKDFMYDAERDSRVQQQGGDALTGAMSTMTGEGYAAIYDGIGGAGELGAKSSGEAAIITNEFFDAYETPRTMQQAEAQMRALFIELSERLPEEERQSTAVVSRMWREDSGQMNVTIGSVGDSIAYAVDKQTGEARRLNDVDDMTKNAMSEELIDYAVETELDEMQTNALKDRLIDAMHDAVDAQDFMQKFSPIAAEHPGLAQYISETNYNTYRSERNIISRSLVNMSEYNIDTLNVLSFTLDPGEALVLTSDGISDPLSSAEIGKIVAGTGGTHERANALSLAAKNKLGPSMKDDDASVYIYELDPAEDAEARQLAAQKIALEQRIGRELDLYEDTSSRQNLLAGETSAMVGFDGEDAEARPKVKPARQSSRRESVARREIDELYRDPNKMIEKFEAGPLSIEDMNLFIKTARAWAVGRANNVASGESGDAGLWSLASHTDRFEDYKELSLDISEQYQGAYKAGDHITLNPGQIDNEAEELMQEFEGLTMGEARMIITTHVAAHEAGHAFLNGLGRATDQKNLINRRAHKGSAIYLATRPDMHITGHLNTDAGIFDERFAEGFAHLALNEMLAQMGATDDETRRIREQAVTSMEKSRTANHGDFSLDFISKLQHGQPFSEAKGSDHSKDRQFDVEIGYEIPLTDLEIIDVMEGMGDILRDGGVGAHINRTASPEGWENATEGVDSAIKLKLVESALERKMRFEGAERDKTLRGRAAKRVGSYASRFVESVRGQSYEQPISLRRERIDQFMTERMQGQNADMYSLVKTYKKARSIEGGSGYRTESNDDLTKVTEHAAFSTKEGMGAAVVSEELLRAEHDSFESMMVTVDSDNGSTIELGKGGGVSMIVKLDAAGQMSKYSIHNATKGSMNFTPRSPEWNRVKTEWEGKLSQLTGQLNKGTARGDNVLLERRAV